MSGILRIITTRPGGFLTFFMIQKRKLDCNTIFKTDPQIPQTRLPLRARPPAKQGEAAWGTSGQVTQTCPPLEDLRRLFKHSIRPSTHPQFYFRPSGFGVF